MKFLVDENIAQSVTKALQDMGYEILSVSQWKPSATDIEVLRKAKEEDWIIVTQDKDFAHLFFKEKIKPGILLLRMGTLYPEKVKEKLCGVLEQLPEKKLEGRLVTIFEEEVMVQK